ncbi:response regulator [Roseateles chitinivorans]|uniref:response regulator n=1 Tax=Roseateles chitinivorans TaxID=2917965 RepID=UPI003D676AC8
MHSKLDVTIAVSGAAGLTCFETMAPDVVLLDMQLPDLDGLEVLRRLRQLPSYRDQPIAIFTAAVAQEDKKRAFAAGASAFGPSRSTSCHSPRIWPH